MAKLENATDTYPLVAYRLPGYASYPEIVCASGDREWMDTGTKGWANRCLPLRIANQAGWMILNDADVEIVWTGQRRVENLKVLFPAGPPSPLVSSMFGYGIVTWIIPYLFRTAPGFNLYVRGPANTPRNDMFPLDGIVETDWLPYAFTMNWQITKRFRTVRVKRGEPICMVMPIRRGELDQVEPVIRNLESNPELLTSYRTWLESRKAKVEETKHLPQDPSRIRPQGHYIRGEGHLGERPERGHETKLHLRPFAVPEPPITQATAREGGPKIGPKKGLFGWVRKKPTA